MRSNNNFWPSPLQFVNILNYKQMFINHHFFHYYTHQEIFLTRTTEIDMQL